MSETALLIDYMLLCAFLTVIAIVAAELLP